MKPTFTTALVFAMTIATSAAADSRIARFCGLGHTNEMASVDDVKPNPDGYFVMSLVEQVSEGDPRIILTNEDDFYLCTRQFATPDMSANDIFRLRKNRQVKFLFVPIAKWTTRPSS